MTEQAKEALNTISIKVIEETEQTLFSKIWMTEHTLRSLQMITQLIDLATKAEEVATGVKGWIFGREIRIADDLEHFEIRVS